MGRGSNTIYAFSEHSMKIVLLTLCIALTACGARENPAKIAEPQREALGKAKAAASMVELQAADLAKKIDEAESK
jgi:hypothetical protein